MTRLRILKTFVREKQNTLHRIIQLFYVIYATHQIKIPFLQAI